MNVLAYSGFRDLPAVAQWAIYAVMVLAIFGIVIVLAKAFGMEIPGWVKTIFWICVAAAVGIVAIRFIASL